MTKLNRFIRRYTSIAATIDILRRKELPLLDPQSWDDRNDRYFMSLYKEAQEINGLYALCAATCSETYHHWRVFTAAADGACIEIKRGPLETALSALPGVRFGKIEYLLLDDVEQLGPADRVRLPFIKRAGFKPETEYRIIAETSDAQTPALAVEFPIELINKIYLNPWLPASIADSLTGIFQSIPGCEGLSVSRSHLIDSGRWKRSGDRVVGKKKPPKIKLVKPAATSKAKSKPATKPKPRVKT
ncbi:DUF2971 domain-containing protein [Sphingosinicella sp. BN140058]|uniref:DUF2971 domain-containing protein n=1 Tax=Sphingosinicella sp. BN140058 TaxID=1892855 RepID=UPI001011D87B|nr:DUF2971 domain-containing protein [Sphingosinicella sp. BN140058]QAY78681.1 DUF2971 domain-containing protein [Sphingosinicella sp. BN140058]